jgi:ABC-2 type transport system permease protein
MTTTLTATAPSARSQVLTHSGLLTLRSVRALIRQPWYAAITLVQPVIWLLLFGQLFRSVVHIPGFQPEPGPGGPSYLEFISPGVIMMTVLFSAAWAGTTYIEDMNRGVMDRLLASPVSRGAIMIGTLAYQVITTLIQTLVVFGIAYAVGARFPGGITGILVTLIAAALLCVVFAALSNAVALLARTQEALIGISQFLSLPLAFVSSAVMAVALAPDWLQAVARYNPVDWAVRASREALSADPDWGAALPRLGYLALLAVGMAWLATRAFRTYQRST